MSEATIELPPPPSVNRTRGEHWGATRQRKARLQHEITVLLYAARVPRPIPGGRVHATAVVTYPKARRRDEGNIRAGLEKALADALVAAGFLPDDTTEHFRFGELSFAVEPGRRAVARVRLAW